MLNRSAHVHSWCTACSARDWIYFYGYKIFCRRRIRLIQFATFRGPCAHLSLKCSVFSCFFFFHFHVPIYALQVCNCTNCSVDDAHYRRPSRSMLSYIVGAILSFTSCAAIYDSHRTRERVYFFSLSLGIHRVYR